jgi:CPA2 family monovalent cation:H+ antiporter-2
MRRHNSLFISLSSTSVVIQLLQEGKILTTKLGQGVLGILLFQDLAVIPMLIIMGLYSTENAMNGGVHIHLIKQGIGTLLAIILLP